MNAFRLVLLAVVGAVACSSCTSPTTVEESYSYEPHPMTEKEFEAEVEKKVDELIKQEGLSRSEADRKAKRDVEKEKWRREFTPVKQWRVKFKWE